MVAGIVCCEVESVADEERELLTVKQGLANSVQCVGRIQLEGYDGESTRAYANDTGFSFLKSFQRMESHIQELETQHKENQKRIQALEDKDKEKDQRIMILETEERVKERRIGVVEEEVSVLRQLKEPGIGIRERFFGKLHSYRAHESSWSSGRD